jgi:hypothetical protein
LQGEGQEFESPRLHHSPAAKSKISGHPEATKIPRIGRAGPIDPLIHVLPSAGGHRPADRWTALDFGRGVARSHPRVRPHLNNWIVFGRKEESSISPSSQGNDPDRSQPVTDHLVRGWRGSSYKGHGVDALAPRADEGRGRLRKASGSREQTVIRRCPNGETRLGSCPVTPG